MIKLSFKILFSIGFLSLGMIDKGSAQEVWSLQKCIGVAIENSLQIQNSEVSLDMSELDVSQARHYKYPTLNGSANLGWNFGRSIDPTSNSFISTTFLNNGYGLNSSVVLYNGGKIKNNLEKSILSNQAVNKNLEQTKRDISLNVASLYLNIMYAKENVKNAKNQMGLTQQQLDQLKKQIQVGNRPENDVLDLDAQMATNNQSIIEAENLLNINLLNLKQWLRLNPDFDLDIEVPQNLDLTTDPDILTFDEVFQSAQRNQPSIQAGEINYKAAQVSEEIAKADLYPQLALWGNGRTNYSNQGKSVDGYESVVATQDIILNGQSVQIGIPQSVPNFVNTPYNDQLSGNLSYGFGFNVSVPIYNNSTGRIGVQRARLNTESANLNLIQVKETLKITIGQALADAKAAKAKYQATLKTQEAQNNLYHNATKRFEIGTLNSFELTRIKTQMETSIVNGLIAKYEYFFRVKVLDFYLGRPILF